MAILSVALTDDRVTTARRQWLARALALGEHRRGCLVLCGHGQPCCAYDRLDQREIDAWESLEQARAEVQ